MTEPYLGRIEVATRAIESIAGLAVLESYGVVGMAPKDSREYVAALLPRANFRRGVDVKYVEMQVLIDLYVIIEYGTRISQVAIGIKNRVKYVVERDTGLTVAQVNVHVQGLRVSDGA
ncbi:MAG: Asp23/Gls24 family envelope stress response protein [Chloroflexi bacterium]|nr:Asp23/Gls24 family envelope stress response protein [Chloroflexota bacterium]